MRVVVVGLGVQGKKRVTFAMNDVVATVDPTNQEATYRELTEVPLETYDTAILCVPDEPKYGLIKFLLDHKKHVLVEKPLWVKEIIQITELERAAKKNKVRIQIAYNHRFEPNIIKLKELIDSGILGTIYSIRIFYGNGTAKLVRDSEWRDQGSGVLMDLGSHLLDILNFLVEGSKTAEFKSVVSNFENRAPDHAILISNNPPLLVNLEMTLCMWKNTFTLDILGTMGSAHVEGLCKWGPSTLTRRIREFPSGVPSEEITTIPQGDPTWSLEYADFKKSITEKIETNLAKDMWILESLTKAIKVQL
jgi:scyllo-inositol 2-dehydrogenase (NADP+)